MKINKVIPTVFARNKKEFNERLEGLIGIAGNIQVDIGDGKFVKFKSISIKDIPNLGKYKNNFEVHLMVKNPENYIKLAKSKGFDKIIFHYEAIGRMEIDGLIEKIKRMKMKVFIALNPETDISKILPFLSKVDGVLLMGVHPGGEHKKFIPKIYSKIIKLKKFDSGIQIEIDGGVNFNNIRRLATVGANEVSSGSLVAESSNPGKTIKKLKKMFI